jgi:hypothetical protein
MRAPEEPRSPQTTPSDITAAPSGAPPATGDEAIRTAPGTDSQTVKQPTTRRAPLSPDRFQRRLLIPDGLVVVLVLAFAVFLAAQPVHNGDLLTHLATGRALIQGEYNPLTMEDPFAHTTEGVRWVNQSWLADLLAYGIYRTAGPFVPEEEAEDTGILVLNVLKALVTFALAVVLILAGRAGVNLWVPALCTALGLLVLSPGLQLRPLCISFLFLGLTLWLLLRVDRRSMDSRNPGPLTWKAYWPLLPLFALWANLDEWFFLGPLLVGLFAASQVIQASLQGPVKRGQPEGPHQPRPGQVRALTITFVAGLAACLLNPHHLFVFQPPFLLGLSDTAAIFQNDRSLRWLLANSFDSVFFRSSGISVAHLAFFALAVLGLLSFALNYRAICWWRVLVFGLFLLLGIVRVALIPFFAVVAAPIMALNFHDFAARFLADPGRERAWRSGLVGGRVLSLLVLGLLLAAAWPGWLQMRPFAWHRVSFVNEIDPSPGQTARWFAEQRASNRLPASARIFNLTPSTGAALAWYCPGEKSFFDHRWGLYPTSVVRDYVEVCQALLGTGEGPRPQKWSGAEKILAKRRVDCLVLRVQNPESLIPALDQFWGSSAIQRLAPNQKAEWEQLYLRGRIVVFGWARQNPAYQALRSRPNRQAYSPAEATRAPAGGMPYLPVEQPFWAAYYHRPGPQPPESDEARLHLIRFQAEKVAMQQQTFRLWEVALTAGSLVGVQPGGLVPASFPALVVLRNYHSLRERAQSGRGAEITPLEGFIQQQFLEGFLASRDDAPPAHLFLAIRAARQALAKNPEDAFAHFYLGQAYLEFLGSTRERALYPAFPQLQQVRYLQAVAAFRQALLLKEDLTWAHEALFRLFWTHNAHDLALKHRQAQLEQTRLGGPRQGQSVEQFVKYIESFEKEVKDLEQRVRAAENEYENSKNLFPRVIQRAQKARQLGLAGKALDILVQADEKDFSEAEQVPFALLQISLALSAGEVWKVQGWFSARAERVAAEKEKEVNPDLHELQAFLAAAIGDYREADKSLAVAAKERGQVAEEQDIPRLLREGFGVAKVPTDQPRVVAIRAAVALGTGEIFLGLLRQKETILSPVLIGERLGKIQPVIFASLPRLLRSLQLQARCRTLRGILALEAGQVEEAAGQFRLALQLWQPVPNDPSVPGVSFPGRRIAQEWLQTLEKYR